MKINIENWNVEDAAFWKNTGNKIAKRNLWISIPALLLAFSVWLMWSIIIVGMEKLGFTFGMLSQEFETIIRNTAISRADYPAALTESLKSINSLYYTLPAIAGLAGATLRIPNSFLIAIGGGRNVIFTTTALLLIPAIGVGVALQDVNTPFMTFAILAALSGFGGGNFASSMSNISFFFPKKVQGTSLGLNAGLGNLGVSVMQFLLPITMGAAVFGAFGGDGNPLLSDFKGSSAGSMYFLQNAGWTWVPLLLLAVIAAFIGMNNIKTATPKMGSAAVGIGKTLFLVLLGLVAAAVGVYLLVTLKINMWIVLPVVVILTVLLMKYLSPGEIKESLNRQFSIFNNKHNWIMTIIYTMTFGSFIGFSAAFPKLISDVFGSLPDGSINPNAPSPYTWAFLGPMVGALIRPVGGWLSDKINSGSKVTQWATVAQIAAALGVAFFVIKAREAATPEMYWWPFFILFMILFITTGIGNGSTFRSIPYIFSKELAGPVLGWTSAIAAYGAFIIPKVFGQQIKIGHPEYALYGFAIYYVVCLILNWWYYERKNSGIEC
jgi:NNP family nitrate/nitrite transporter-like MFS transporter